MNARLFALFAVILGFGALTILTLLDVGYLGLWQMHMTSLGGWQVLLDLVILALLACCWMVHDARSSGVPAWPFVLLTLAGGSFGPLFYLVARELRAPERRVAAGTA